MDCTMREGTNPGAMALTVMCDEAKSEASFLVK
jgi:hypothetical protein